MILYFKTSLLTSMILMCISPNSFWQGFSAESDGPGYNILPPVVTEYLPQPSAFIPEPSFCVTEMA